MSAGKTLRVLIVDDEPLARQRLEDLLAPQPGFEVAGVAESGRQGVEAIRRIRPDLVFLDIQMPGLTGIDVVREVGPEDMPVVIFVTAYDQYALKAFDVAALDYLVKPFDDERFLRTLARARQAVELRDAGQLRDRLAVLLQGPAAEPAATPPAPKYLERFAVELRGQIRVVPVSLVDFISASGQYAELHVGEEVLLLRERMQTLEERLDPEQFFRAHRSAIVRLDRIDALLYSAGGDYALRLKDGRRLPLSRNRRDDLEQRLGISPAG